VPASTDAAATVTLTKAALPVLITQGIDAALAGGMTITGDASVLAAVLSVLQPGDPAFAIVTP
jgi:alkyl sulfatase BDS1-like metallo-beta-lactamase superfamily hydrolase